RGWLLVRALEQDHLVGLEILALDQGPGITNIGASLRDGYSTAGSPGTGLGAIVRLSAFFDIYSQPGKGTALLTRLWAKNEKQSSKATLPAEPLEIGAVCLAQAGEDVSGDSWAVQQGVSRCVIMVADGLGHGLEAAKASNAAVGLLSISAALDPLALIQAAHDALHSTRGAAVAVVELDLERSLVKFAGVGNIAGTIFTADTSRHLASYNGTVGHEMRKIQEFTYSWSTDALLVLHSDGLGTHWDLNAYPGLASRHPSLIAGVLYRDFNRGRDDVTVLVAKSRDWGLEIGD
ncbi:MAG TPA: SpoIIE family protein phosphatase, partial [Anaerolineae bacterium]|nr:SpoIIE family protein phosphatase [Anaerolineae bacterium]